MPSSIGLQVASMLAKRSRLVSIGCNLIGLKHDNQEHQSTANATFINSCARSPYRTLSPGPWNGLTLLNTKTVKVSQIVISSGEQHPPGKPSGSYVVNLSIHGV